MHLILWRYELRKRRERALLWIARHLPHELQMWTYINVVAHATTGKYGNTNVCDLNAMDALKRWDNDHDDERLKETSMTKDQDRGVLDLHQPLTARQLIVLMTLLGILGAVAHAAREFVRALNSVPTFKIDDIDDPTPVD